MKELTREQKKIIYIAAGVFLFIVIFWVFIYAPQSKKLKIIKQELKSAEEQIAEIRRLTQGKDLTDMVTQLNRQLDKTDDMLPVQEEAVINFLSQNARALNIDIKNMNISDRRNTGQRVAGKEIQELPVSLILAGDYKSIGEFINILVSNHEVLIKVRDLNIKGSGPGRPILDSNLEIAAYVLPDSQ